MSMQHFPAEFKYDYSHGSALLHGAKLLRETKINYTRLCTESCILKFEIRIFERHF